LNFEQLERIAERHITKNTNKIPANAFELAQKLNLRVKNSIECKQDFKEQYPLYKCNAAYTLVNGEYTIYHDEKYAYKNFSVAHEIAHHLLEHYSDGIREHHDANLLAAIILLSPEGIKKNKIKNATELSEKCLIPYDVAIEYWSNIKNISKPPKKRIKYRDAIDIALIVALFATLCFIGFANKTEDKQTNIQKQITTTAAPDVTYTPVPKLSPAPQIEATNTTTVYATSSGKKYHIAGCRYIKNKTNITPLTPDEAVTRNLQPCSICIGQ